MSTIPISELFRVNPSVLGPGGTAVAINGLFLDNGPRVPIGTVAQFPTGAAVTSYFGAGSIQDVAANGGANEGTGYFGGSDGSDQKPSVMLVAQYNQSAVGAWLRGGNVSTLTVAQLQAISGSLNITVDGYPFNASSVNLSAATSFSSAATIIATALNAADPSEASFTGSIGASFTAAIATTVLTVSAISANERINVGDTVVGSGVAANTKIASLGTGTGGTGTYNLTGGSQTVGSEAMTTTSNVLDVTTLASGALAVGQTILGTSVGAGTVITALGTGTGGTGTYVVSGAAQTVTSEAMTSEGTPVTVTFDSQSGGFQVSSGITGAPSTIAFATGTISSTLLLTSATGAVTSQGAAAASPSSFMTALTMVSQNWATFTTMFDPDASPGTNTNKLAFAAWKNGQNNRFMYVPWDLDQAPTVSLPAASSLGYVLENTVADSGSFVLGGETSAGWTTAQAVATAAMVMGTAASIDFSETGGRTSFAFRSQPGMFATVVDPIAALNLGGDPQTAGSFGNSYNFYGAYGAANANFLWLQRGQVTGTYTWADSYINQIWLNTGFQSDLANYYKTAKSTPFSNAGYGALEAVLMPRIQAALDFGMFGPAPLSATQIAEVNAAAGKSIAQTLQSVGYYLQILPATPSQRAARTSPPMKFWYIDQGSIQAINLSSIALQ